MCLHRVVVVNEKGKIQILLKPFNQEKNKIKFKVSFFKYIFQINVELYGLFGTKQIVISHASQTVNQTEGIPNTVKTFLSKHCADHPNDWDDHLSAVSFAFNITHLVYAFL